MYESAAFVKEKDMLVDVPSPLDYHDQVQLAQDRFVGCMYSPSTWHEHVPPEVSHSKNEFFIEFMQEPRLPLGGRNLPFFPWFTIRFIIPQHPVSGLRQMTAYRCYSFGVPFVFAHPLIQAYHMAIRPAVLVQHYGIRSFGKGPFQITVHIGTYFAIVGLSPAGIDPGHFAGIAGKLFRCGESVYTPNLKGYHYSQYRPHAGKSLKKLHSIVPFDNLTNAFLRLLNGLFYLVQQPELLLNREPGLRRQFIQRLLQQFTPFPAKEVAHLIKRYAVFGKGRMNTILKLSANLAQGHSHSRQLPLVAEFPWRNPNRWQGAVTGQNSQSPSIQFVSLVELSHHQFGLGRMCQSRPMARIFPFVNHPIPVPHALYRNLTSRWQTLQKRAVAFSVMLYPRRRDNLAGFADTSKYRGFFLGLTPDIILHAAVPPYSLFDFPHSIGGTAALSYNQRHERDCGE